MTIPANPVSPDYLVAELLHKANPRGKALPRVGLLVTTAHIHARQACQLATE